MNELGVKASTDSVERLRSKKKPRVFRTKRERKELKERKRAERDFAEADAQVSAEEREHLQSETLKIVFSIYFRTLKETEDDALLSVVLEGISRFARLINAEFFGDLLEVLREILEIRGYQQSVNRDRTSEIRQELVCLNTAFTLLANQGSPNVDLSFFIDRFYDLLFDIGLSSTLPAKRSTEEKSLMELVIRITDAILFNPPTPAPPSRILLFYKRFLTCSLHMQEREARTILQLLHRLSGRFGKKVEGLWDVEGTTLASLGTANGIRGWENALLERYYCRDISTLCRNLCRSEAKGPKTT